MAVSSLSVQETTWSSRAAQETCQFGVSSGCLVYFQFLLSEVTIFIPGTQERLQH